MSEAYEYLELFRIAEFYGNILKDTFGNDPLHLSYTTDNTLLINGEQVKNTQSGIIKAIIDITVSSCPDLEVHINKFKSNHPDKAQYLDNKLYCETIPYVNMPEGYFE